MIGGTIARSFLRQRSTSVSSSHVAASNAGGSGSVVGDTTTTLMWIDGVSPLAVLHAFVAAIPALFIFGIIGAIQQNGHQPIVATAVTDVKVDYGKLVIVFLILALRS